MNQKKKNIPPDRNQTNKLLKVLWPYLILVFSGMALYWHTLTFDYTYLDDNELILNNLNILKNIRNIGLLFREDVFFSFNDAYYRPLLTLSFLIDAQWGEDLKYFHLTNIFIHVINGCLVFILFSLFGYKKAYSFFASLTFVFHPILTQAVAWIPGRNDSLLALFIISSFIMLLKYLHDYKVSHYLLHILLFTAALFTKETALLFIFICLFYIIYVKKEKKYPHDVILLMLGWSLIVFIWLFMRSSAMQHPVGYNLADMVISIYRNLPALIQFLGKIFFPFNLSVLPIIQDTTIIWGILAFLLLAGIILFVAPNKRYKFILFGSLWFILFLFPSFIRPNPNVIADFIEHRVYLPLVGIFIILGEVAFFQKLDFKKWPHLLLMILLVASFSTITFIHSQHFKDKFAFWLNAAENSPHHPLAQRNLGAMYFLEEQYDKAEIQFKKSLALNPNEPMAHMNLGLIAMNRNQFAKAESLYIREIQINPNYENVYFNLGILYYRIGRIDLAEKMWKKTIELHRNFIAAYVNLAILYYEQNQIDQARKYLLAAHRMGGTIPAEVVKIIGLPE